MDALDSLAPEIQTIFTHIEEGIVITDMRGNLRYANQSIQALLNLPENIALLNLKSICSVNLQLRIIKALLDSGMQDAVSMEQTAFVTFEQTFEIGNLTRYLSIRTGLFQLQNGERQRLLLFKDISDLKRLEARVQATGTSGILTRDSRLLEVIRQVSQVAPTEAFVLLQGESGTGKNLIAHLIHKLSHRSDRPFIELNCAAIPETLIESELFGHVKGAFTGATETRQGRFSSAHSGTLFLDEIGELPMHLQAKLLKAVQELRFEPVGSSKTQVVDVRIIAASNRNLRDAVDAHQFRADLYYRLSVIPVHIPPLRERKGDIPFLIDHFYEKLVLRGYPAKIKFSDVAMRLMMEYPWPGNVRELQNAVEHAIICAADGIVQVEALPQDIRENRPASISQPNRGRAGVSQDQLRGQILFALKRCQGNRHEAAKMLGIERTTLWRRMKKLGLD